MPSARAKEFAQRNSQDFAKFMTKHVTMISFLLASDPSNALRLVEDARKADEFKVCNGLLLVGLSVGLFRLHAAELPMIAVITEVSKCF